MTKQLRLVEPGSPSKRSVWPLDQHTREVGLEGIRSARRALGEANRRVAERDAERLARRDDELADRARAAARLSLAFSEGPDPIPGSNAA